MDRFGPLAGCKACAGRGGSHTHECRARLEECARARAEAQAPEVASQPDADVPEELTGQGMDVGVAQAASQEAHAQARQGPVAVPAEPSAGSGAQASSASKREIESRELGDMSAFDMDVEGVSPEVSVPKKSRIAPLTIAGKWVNVLMQTAMMVMLVVPSGGIYGQLSGELLDPLLVQEGRERERENLRKFGVYERVPRHHAAGERIRVQWLDDYKRNLDGTVFVRSRLVAMHVPWETRADCFAGTPALCCVRLVLSFASTLCKGRKSRLCGLHDLSVGF